MGRSTQSDELRKYGQPVVYLLTGGIEHLVDASGGVFLGMSIRSAQGDALVVVRADFEGKRMVGFASGATAAGALVRLHTDLRGEGLKWRQDKYAKNGEGD